MVLGAGWPAIWAACAGAVDSRLGAATVAPSAVTATAPSRAVRMVGRFVMGEGSWSSGGASRAPSA